MTVYDLLCCYKSPNWYNYCNLLDYADQYFPSNVERSLPPESVDSYLGRLISLALEVNTSWKDLTLDNLEELEHVNVLFCKAGIFSVRPWNSKVRSRVVTFLGWGLPTDWLAPMLKVFHIGLWSWSAAETQLNEPRFLAVLRELSRSPYPVVKIWFEQHPNAAASNTAYDLCYNEENT